MICKDDCHNYSLDSMMGELKQTLRFFEMRLDGTKKDGTTNEDIIKVLIHRINFLNEQWQGGKFKCRENSIAITKLEEALMWLEKRTLDRVSRNVEGTHNV
jgi:hypothetical protein